MYKAISRNKRNTVWIALIFLVVIGGLGYLASVIYGDPTITYIVIGVALFYALIQFFAASHEAMAVSGGQEVTKKEAPELYDIVENLAISVGLPTPRVFVIEDPAPNAFATGRNPKTSMVAVTTGLTNIMNKRELTAVLAHEMSHVQNYDILVNMIVFGLVSAIGMICDLLMRMAFFGGRGNSRNNNNAPLMIFGLVALIVSPIIALAVQMAVSRQREYLADANGTLIDRDPDAMVSALEKLRDGAQQPMQRQSSVTAHMFFADPLKPGFFSRMFSTHPPLDERIARIKANAARM
ncbi:MAG: M48 family metalloprotease [Candidatus Nanoperiomorbaceae bacterium]